MSPKNALGKHLRALRTQRSLTLDDVAARVGVCKPYLNHIEVGNMMPGESLIPRLARVLDADADELTNLAGRIPRGLRAAQEGNPLLVELVRLLAHHRLPDAVYRQMIDLARGGQ